MCKFDQYLHTSRKSGINVYAICVGWVNFVHNLRCLLKNLRSQQKFYATAGPTGPDKYELCELLEDIEDGSEGLEVNSFIQQMTTRTK